MVDEPEGKKLITIQGGEKELVAQGWRGF